MNLPIIYFLFPKALWGFYLQELSTELLYMKVVGHSDLTYISSSLSSLLKKNVKTSRHLINVLHVRGILVTANSRKEKLIRIEKQVQGHTK